MNTAALFGAAVFLFLGSGLTGCASKPASTTKKSPTNASEFGQWRGVGTASRVLNRDGVTKNERWSIGLEVVSRTPGYGRIEVTGAMGVYGGTIAWNKAETKILLPGQRKFVVAPSSVKAFVSILPFPISPSEVEAILFDRDFDLKTLASRKISCKVSGKAEGAKEVCSSASGFLLERTRGEANVSFEVSTDDGANVIMQLKPVRAKVEERPELWELEAPRGFKVIQQEIQK